MKDIKNINVSELTVLSDAESSILYKINTDGTRLLMEMDISLFTLEDIRRWMKNNNHWYANAKFVFVHIFDRPVNLKGRKKIGYARVSRANIAIL